MKIGDQVKVVSGAPDNGTEGTIVGFGTGAYSHHIYVAVTKYIWRGDDITGATHPRRFIAYEERLAAL